MGQGVALCLDISRLVGRAGRQLTGVDRVEIAYLEHFLALSTPVFGLCQTRLGVLVLDRSGLAAVADALRQKSAWGEIDWIGRLRRRAPRAKMAAEATVRKHAIARGRDAGKTLADLAAKVIYFNVGQTSIKAGVLASLREAGIETRVLLHDAIPVSFPQWHTDVTVKRFQVILGSVSKYADRVIYNSRATQTEVAPRLASLGREPNSQIALLGTDHLAGPSREAPTLDPAASYCLCVGTLDLRKNQEFLLDLWESWETDDRPDLIFCGALGHTSTSMQNRLASLPSGITWRQNLTDTEIADLTQGALCALFPSQAEGFGFPPAEALSLGTPAICAPLPVYREVLGDKVVYAALSDAYHWKKAIMTLAERGAMPVSGAIDLPSWKAHFNIVLSDVC